jgi:hypothetical protein
LHALYTPPTFILSQDQTLKKNSEKLLSINRSSYFRRMARISAIGGSAYGGKLSKKENFISLFRGNLGSKYLYNYKSKIDTSADGALRRATSDVYHTCDVNFGFHEL